MSDSIAVVTGANTGIGYQTALALARAGARVVMACRSPERGHKAQADLLAQVPAARAEVLQLDVSEPESIRAFGRSVADRFGRLDLLINNAGIVGVPLLRNSAGHELHLATNYLGAFALTGTLLPLFRDGVPGRVVNVGSLAHRFGRLDVDDLNWETTPYGEWKAYTRSKLAVLVFTMELERRLRRSGRDLIAVAAHPGFAVTEAGRYSETLKPRSALHKWIQDKIATRISSAAEASQPILHAACGDGVRGGDYYGPSGFLEIHGSTGRARLNPMVKDVDLGLRLWAASESLTGVRFLSEP